MKLNVLRIAMVFIFSGMMFSSCVWITREPKENTISEYEKIIEQKDCQSILNDLYIASEGDIKSLSLIFKTSPTTIERLRKGETKATKEFEDVVKEVYLYYITNGLDFKELKVKYVFKDVEDWESATDAVSDFASSLRNVEYLNDTIDVSKEQKK